MFGFYQFLHDNYYNKPIGGTPGLSIFPYTGLNNNLPYSRPIPIRRGRYSASTLDKENNPYPTAINTTSQHTKGPLPYIYKLRLSGISNKYTCNPNCTQLNDKDIYLYGNPGQIINSTIYWMNTFVDTEVNGIYIRADYDDSSSNYGSTTQDALLDTAILFLVESLDPAVDKSWLILTLGSSLHEDRILRPVNDEIGTIYPCLFVKEFAKDERIFALEEGIELTYTTSITIDHGIYNGAIPAAYRNIRIDTNGEVCNFSSASCTLSPYQTETYDIQNNHNVYAEHLYHGLMSNNTSTTSVVTSSGTIDVDKFYNTSAPRLLDSPGYYKLTLSRVETRNQGQHVPCDIFFNRSFYLKHSADGLLVIDRNRFDDTGGIGPDYSLDSEVERNFQQNTLGAYFGLSSYKSLTVEPYLDNINLSVFGTGNYLQLSFAERDPKRLVFRHNYDPSIPLRATTFNNWYYHSEDGQLNTYCNFDNVNILLEPMTSTFKQGKKEMSCAPLCNDNTTPTIANIEVRISGHMRGQVCDGGSPVFHNFEYDQTFNVIVDLKSSFFDNPEGTFNPQETYDGLSQYSLAYRCNDNGEDLARLILNGFGILTNQTINWSVAGGFTCSETPKTLNFSKFTVDALKQVPWEVSGCPIRFNCAEGLPFNGFAYLENQDTLLLTNFTGPLSSLAATGIITFDGFL